jgi:hypothetical protein
MANDEKVKRPTCEKGGRPFLGSDVVVCGREGMEAEGGEVGRFSAVVLPCAKSVRIGGMVQ